MAQHDYVIDNSTGANVRADINSVLQAIATNNSDSTAPSTTFALQTFANTTDSMLQLRNSANNAFVNLRKFDGSLPLPDGSASSPSLFFDDDTNTGVFSGGADEINISTGGTERFVVDSSGKVGIGTNPSYKFHVSASDFEVARFESTNANADGAYVELVANSSSPADNDILGILNFKGNNDASQLTTYAQIRVLATDVTDGTEDGDITFHTRSNGSFGERVRINSSGQVGINTSSPNYRLDVRETTGNGLRVKAGDDSSDIALSVGSAGTADKFVVLSSGSVGIGTSSPDNLLHLFESNTTQTANTESQLVLEKNNNSGITILSGNVHNGRILFGDSGDNDIGQIDYDHNNNSLKFVVNASERIRIDSSGNVLVGRTDTTINTSNHGIVLKADGSFDVGSDQNASNNVARFFGNSGKVNIRGDGDLENTNGRYGQVSDIKYKENIVDANSQWNDIKAIKVRNFNFKSSTGWSTHKQIGIVAQELEVTSPSLVNTSYDTENDESYKSVAQSIVYMKAVKCLQEAMAKIETLETKVAALEAA